MVSFGLGAGWRCSFANDLDVRKAASYCANHGGGKEFRLGDVADITLEDLPGTPDLVWASFPCQDLSLAGKGAGLAGERSGTFAPFWKTVQGLCGTGRAPKIVAVENVYGTITSRGGRDFATIAKAFAELGYSFGAMVIDAVHFLPQSRPRFFMVGVHGGLRLPAELVGENPSVAWHPRALVDAKSLLPKGVGKRWVWWNLPVPGAKNISLASIIEDEPAGVEWHSPAETRRLLGMMADLHRDKVKAAKKAGGRVVGTIYRRTRPDAKGVRRQRAEVRFDETAGCLRTPTGGSSRQTIIVVEGNKIRTRLLSPREAASLMGLPDSYKLPERYNDAYKLAGDGVAVPVVRHLADSIFEPVLRHNRLTLVA